MLTQAHPTARAQATEAAGADGQQPPQPREVLVALYQAGRRLRIAASHSAEQRLSKRNRRQIIIPALHGSALFLGETPIKPRSGVINGRNE